jgi:N-methylhydantoinase A
VRVVRAYDRSLATIMNAGVMPAVGTYIQRLRRRLTDADITAPLLLMQSNGGVAGAATIGRAPALTVLSGPAAGVVGARDVAAAAGIGDIVTVDIGGTSADICLLRGGQIALTQRGHIGEWPLPLPMVDMVTIGAGGGSIARLSDGALMVGPASAGAMPGPACAWYRSSEGTIRATSLWCRSVAPARCMAAPWRSCSALSAYWCRPRRVCCAPRGCWRRR